MAMSKRGRDVSKMSMEELAEAGVPYLVSPDHLKALGLDPEDYVRCGGDGRRGWAGWRLDRKKDAALIERVRALEESDAQREMLEDHSGTAH
jgi:hypothetical protein